MITKDYQPIFLASRRLLSVVSISTSLFMVLFSQCLHPFTMLSASLDMVASLNTVVASFSTLKCWFTDQLEIDVRLKIH